MTGRGLEPLTNCQDGLFRQHAARLLSFRSLEPGADKRLHHCILTCYPRPSPGLRNIDDYEIRESSRQFLPEPVHKRQFRKGQHRAMTGPVVQQRRHLVSGQESA